MRVILHGTDSLFVGWQRDNTAHNHRQVKPRNAVDAWKQCECMRGGNGFFEKQLVDDPIALAQSYAVQLVPIVNYRETVSSNTSQSAPRKDSPIHSLVQ